MVDVRYCKNCDSVPSFFDFSSRIALITETVWVGSEMYIYHVCPNCGYYECDDDIEAYVEERELNIRKSSDES